MDVNIRQVLAAANATNNADHARNLLLQAHKLLDAASKESSHIEGQSPCGPDLFVIAAEIAIKLQETKVADGLLQMYFQGLQVTDQFLCRAYICKAQLLSSKSPNSSAALDSAVVFLLKAINFAKDKPRYHFIVYNVSVLFWQMARPFLRPGLKGLLHQSLQQVVKALSDIEDPDYDWRATLMVALVESLVDAGKIKDAITASENVADFTLKYASLRFKDVFRLQIRHKLVDSSKLSKRVHGSPEFSAFLILQKLKLSASHSNDSDVKASISKDLNKIINLICPTDKAQDLQNPSSKRSSGITEPTSGAISRVSSVSPQPRRGSRVISRGNIDVPLNLVEDVAKDLLPGLLLETARFCADHDEVQLARKCLDTLEEIADGDSSLNLESECLKCVLIVKDLGDMQEIYTQTSVDVRLFAIKRMDQNIENAVRSGNPKVVQAACVTQWNLCLPLLQPNLRKNVRKSLTLVAQSLEDIQSLEVQLRCQLHTELAKCEEDGEQVEAALRHIRKALQLDHSAFYHQRLHTMLRRLELSTKLYQSPDTPEDTAAVIIEQARKSADSGSVRMKRSLLVKAGLALAPDAFQYVLDSEGEVKVTGQKALSEVQRLGATAAQWEKCVKKAAGHLKRLGDENDRERARFWGDLAKVARAQEVWDVCRVASRFCLLYDDGRWESLLKDMDETSNRQPSAPASCEMPRSRDGPPESAPTLQPQMGITDSADLTESNRLNDTDLLRLLAEIQFIYGEAHIHLLQCQGLKLGQPPRMPEDTHQRPKSNASFKKGDTDQSWTTYTEWISKLGTAATKAFLRAIELGVKLRESWIVCSGTAYLWNYNKHLIEDGQLSDLIGTFETALSGLRTVGHSSEIVLFVRVSNLIAQGLLKPWLVSKPPPDPSTEPTPDIGSSKPPSRKKTPGKEKTTSAAGAAIVTVDPDSQDDLKKAIGIIEHAIEITRGSVKVNVIPTAVRHEILTTWALLKQMLQQQIGPGLGAENEVLPAQRDMTKSLLMVEMHTLNKNGMMEFTVPTLQETVAVTENCNWDDISVELEVWSRLAFLAHSIKDHSLVVKCANSAIAFEAAILKKSRKGKKLNRNTVSDYEMLSRASSILGESIMTTLSSNPYGRRQAMDSFVTSARFANSASNYHLVMSACSWWWNACLPLMSSSIERELLRQPLTDLLHYVTSTAIVLKLRIEQKEKDDANSKAVQTAPKEKSPAEEDNHNILRAAMYGVLFQTITDKGQWEEALACMDQAIQHMPRTKHRLPLFKNRIMVKAKLGRSVYADIAKFREESEEYVARMWHRVALSSHEQLQQLSAYQKSIESLHSEENLWVKVEFLVEFSTWLYCNEFPLQDSVNVLEWAVDILFSMKFTPVEQEKSSPSKGKRKPASKPGKTPASKTAPKTNDGKRSVKIDDKPSTAAPEAKKDVDKKDKKEDNLDDVIPVDKEVIIGIKEANTEAKISDFISVKQLEGLARTHIMLSTICGRGSEEHKSYIFLAVEYINRLWEIALAAATPLISQLPKLEENIIDIKKAPNPPAGRDKATKKGSTDKLPQNIIQWANYCVSEDILRAFSFNQGDTAVSQSTIPKPALTVHYLDELVNELCFCGYAHLTLPVICLADVIVTGILKAPSWSNLINMKRIKILYDLGLPDIAKKWEETIGDFSISENERALFVQEREMMIQHEKQVQHEEARIKGTSQASKGKDTASVISDEETLPVTLQGRKIKGLSYRRLWVEKAAILLDLGYRQKARDLLSQAMESAIAFKDHNLLGDIYLNMSRLAIMESNLGQALRFLKLVQDVGGDEQVWYDVTLKVIDSIVLDPDVTTVKMLQAQEFMKATVETMSILRDARPTKKGKLAYIISMITSRSALLKLDNILKRSDGIESSVYAILSELQEVTNTLQSFGFVKEAAHLSSKQAEICLELCERSSDIEQQHSFLLNGLEKMQIASDTISDMYAKVISNVDVSNIQTITLPLARELCNVTLEQARYLIFMGDANAKEQIVLQKSQAKSGSLQHIVDEFIGANQSLTHLQTEWKNVCGLIPQTLFSTLLSAYNLSHSMPEHQARCLSLIGTAMRHLSMHSSENVDMKWSVFFHNINADSDDEVSSRNKMIDSALDEADEYGEPTDYRVASTKSKTSMDSTLTTIQKKKLSENALRIRRGEENAKKFSVQATEILMQSVKRALDLKLLDVVRDASLEIVEASGQLDPALASQYLALHQSARVSISFEEFLLKAQPDPATSQFASLLHQKSWLMKESPYLKNSSLYEWLQKNLHSFTAWRRLSLQSNSLDITKDFPPNFNFVILQHSPDKRHLYMSLLDKPKSASGDGKGKGKDKQDKSLSRSYNMKMDVNPEILDDLKDKMEDYSQHLMSLLLQSEYQRSQLALRQKMIQQLSVGGDGANLAISDATLAEQEEEEMKVIDEFQDIIDSLERYLHPFVTILQDKLIGPLIRDCETQIESGQQIDANAMETLVLLLDEDLIGLPLEALPGFQTPYIDCLCRDFSLQFLHHRWYVDPEQAALLAEKKKNEPVAKGKVKTPKTGSKDTRKTPGAGAKLAPLNREPLPGCGTVSTNSVKYVIDPLDETAEMEEFKPMAIFEQVLQIYSTSCTAGWSGLMGSKGVPSVGQWENTIHGCEFFIFYGMERFLAHLPPAKVAALDLSACQMMLLLDKAQTSKSFRHQSKIDVDKSDSMLVMEKPLHTIMLLSLVGVNSICSNLWHSTLEDNAGKLQCISKTLLEDGQVVGKGVRRLLNPTLRKPEPPAQEPPRTAPVGKDKPDTKGGKSKGKADSKKSDSPAPSPVNATPESSPTEESYPQDGESVEQVPGCEPVQGSWCNMVLFGLPNLMIV